MAKFVRSSHYRHVFGTAAKKELIYDNIKVSKSAWDTNKVKCNNKFLGVCWEAGGGGSFAVIPLEKTGKLNSDYPLITGHKGPVLDIDFSRFNDHLVASASEDCTVKIWVIPEGGLTSTFSDKDAAQNLIGHKRKAGTVNFHPTANNVLATSAIDYTVRIWDISKGETKLEIGSHGDNITTVAWNYDGSQLATACKDKRIRVIDPRQNKFVADFESHPGVKGARVQFLGKSNKLFTIGFSKSSEREFRIYDNRNFETPLASKGIDNAAGMLIPLYDPDTNLLYLAGKGDGNVRYFELVDEKPYFYYISEFKSNSPQIGMGFVPKTSCDIAECEIARLLKATPTTIEPISFKVPRRSDLFQSDIFPNTAGTEASLEADAWFSGKNADPILISLEKGFKPKPSTSEFKAEKKEETAVKELTPLEMKNKIDELEQRVAYLQAEISKKDLKIKELEGK